MSTEIRRRSKAGHLKGTIRKVDFKVEKIPGTLNDKIIKFEAVMTPEEEAEFTPQIEYTFDQWLKGKIEPTLIHPDPTGKKRGVSKTAAATKKELVSTPAMEGKKVKHELSIIPLSKKFILGVKVYMNTDIDGYHEDEDGKKIKPWACYVFGDGSRVHLTLKKKRGR